MNKTEITINEVVDIVTMTSISVRQFIENLYVNSGTIVHCVNNGMDYPINEKNSLIAYMRNHIGNIE